MQSAKYVNLCEYVVQTTWLFHLLFPKATFSGSLTKKAHFFSCICDVMGGNFSEKSWWASKKVLIARFRKKVGRHLKRRSSVLPWLATSSPKRSLANSMILSPLATKFQGKAFGVDRVLSSGSSFLDPTRYVLITTLQENLSFRHTCHKRHTQTQTSFIREAMDLFEVQFSILSPSTTTVRFFKAIFDADDFLSLCRPLCTSC